MKLYDYLCKRFCIQEEDQKEVKRQVDKWRKDSESQFYKKDPPYLMDPYLTQIKRMTDRYKNMGGKVG